MDAPDPEIAAGNAEVVLGLDGVAYPAYKTDVVKRIQEDLTRRRLYSGEIDGILGEPTKEALAEFQERHGLKRTGIPTPLTRAALRSDESSGTVTEHDES